MDWNTPTLWWLATGALVAAELATGTFYLLMLALGAACGALAAHLGFASTAQVAAAALVGGGAAAGDGGVRGDRRLLQVHPSRGYRGVTR